MDDQGQYYRRRMEAELDAAEHAADDSVAQIHRAMADRYREMAEEGEDEARSDLVEMPPLAG